MGGWLCCVGSLQTNEHVLAGNGKKANRGIFLYGRVGHRKRRNVDVQTERRSTQPNADGNALHFLLRRRRFVCWNLWYGADRASSSGRIPSAGFDDGPTRQRRGQAS